MGAPQYEQAGADIGGSGTTNTIPRWTGPSTLGDSGLIDNGTAIYTTTRNFGIGTPSPGAILHTLGTGTTTGIFATSSANSWIELRRSTSTTLGYIGTGSLVTGGAAADLAFRCESGNLLFSTVATERARIDSAGRFFIGASTTPNVATVRSVVANAGSVYTLFQNTTANVGGAVGNPGSAGLQFWATSGALGAETYTLSFSSNATGLDVSTAGYGLKLPATPGNADTQTLDCYQEGTWTPTLAGFTGTTPTATTRYTRLGRLITIEVFLYAGGATFGSAFGTTSITLPLSLNAAMETCVPVAWGGGASGNGAIGAGSNLILLPSNASTTLARITFTMSI